MYFEDETDRPRGIPDSRRPRLVEKVNTSPSAVLRRRHERIMARTPRMHSVLDRDATLWATFEKITF